jgi:hypothetical protein
MKMSQGTIITPALTLEVSDAIKPSPVLFHCALFHCASFDDIDCWFGNEDEVGGEASAQVNDSLVLPVPSPCSYHM